MLLGSRFNGVWDEAVEKFSDDAGRGCENTPTRDASPPLVLAFLQTPNAITKRYHPTLALMGATRLASGHFSAASSRVVFLAASFRRGSEGVIYKLY